MSGNVIAFADKSVKQPGPQRFSSGQRKVVQALAHIPGYEVSFEREDGVSEWAIISAVGGNYTLVDLVRIGAIPGGFQVVDGSHTGGDTYDDVEEAVIAAWHSARRRMAAFGLR